MSERKLLDDCFLHDKDRISHSDCVTLIRSRLACVTGTGAVPLDQATGRIIAETVAAPRNVPLHDNSAVDGYAFRHADYIANRGLLTVKDRIVAGDTAVQPLGKNQAGRIFTGARMPDGADTVAMQEDCEVTVGGAEVHVPGGLKAGANRRRAGEDLARGDVVIEAGTRLRAQEIAALASLGKDRVTVRDPVRIAILSTGNELVSPGKTLAPGQVFDSNRAMLKSLAGTLPVTISDLGMLPDDGALIETVIAEAARTHDLILTSGGASMGEEDHVVTAIGQLGKRHVWQVAIKPGRPMAFGQIGDCVFIGLPGNPVAAFVCFLLYVFPAITVLGGGMWREPVRFRFPAGFSISRKKPDRREFLRGWLEHDRKDRVFVRKFASDGSGLITGLRQATGLIELAEDVTSVTEGEPVSFIPFSEFGILS